jgi:ABC-type nitrate/sulfonate/bicarbonate transport system substrate-binding protein
MSKLKLLVTIGFLTVLNTPFTVAVAGPKTYLGVSGISFDYIPFWYAKDYRLYQKYNVDVDMITTGGGTVLAQAMLSGGVHFGALGTAFLQSAMQGADHVLLAAHINYFPYRVVGLPSIAGPEGLRGATIAISRFGSNADAALRIALRQAGLDPVKDVTIVQLGTQPERLAALNGRRVQATIMSPPFSSAVQKSRPQGDSRHRQNARCVSRDRSCGLARLRGEKSPQRKRVDASISGGDPGHQEKQRGDGKSDGEIFAHGLGKQQRHSCRCL